MYITNSSPYSAFDAELIDTDQGSFVIDYKKTDPRSITGIVEFPGGKKTVVWLTPLEMGKGVLTTPTRVLETPVGKINVYETTNGKNELSSRMIFYWAYDAQTGEFISFGQKSLWNSDRYDYIRWEQRLLESFCTVA